MITVIIPVFNQLPLLKRCVASVLRNTPSADVRVVIQNDASTDPAVEAYLRTLPADRVLLGYSVENRGFVASVNACIEWTRDRGDVVILNSDTEVPPEWLERMIAARDSAPDVAAVCPLSNSATLYSMPNAGEQDLPKGCTTDQMDALVRELSDHAHPEIPVAMGFCMLLTRRAIREVGLFDEAFGRGYGEEVDWCLRARKQGLKCTLADDVFVWHKGHASFGDNDARDDLRANARAIVDERHPEYEGLIWDWIKRAPLWALRVRLGLAMCAGEDRMRVVYFLHRYGSKGGVEEFVRRRIESVREAEDDALPVVMTPTFRGQAEGRVWWDEEEEVLRVEVNPKIAGTDCDVAGYPLGVRSDDMDRIIQATFRVIEPHSTEVHHYAGWGTLTPPPEEYQQWIHDDYLLCPAFRAADDCREIACGGRRCGGCLRDLAVTTRPRATGEAEDVAAAQWLVHAAEPITFAEDRYAVSLALAARVKRVFGLLPELDTPEFVDYPRVFPRVPSAAKRIAFVGRACDAKGWKAFAAMARKYRGDPRVSFQVIGPIALEADRGGLDQADFRGEYDAIDLPNYLGTVDVAVPAVARYEAYGMVVDECKAYAPRTVIPHDVDAMQGRIQDPEDGYQWGDASSLAAACGLTP